MNDDMPWIPELTQEEIQQLRNNKNHLTEYGIKKIRELMKNQEPYPDEFFEEAERRETANKEAMKVSREDKMKTAVGFINTYSLEIEKLTDLAKEEPKEQLEALKKENFQKIADCCMEEYRQKYGEMPEDEHWMYMIGEFYATGEGQTTCLMVTQANASCAEDFTYEGEYKELTTKQYRAVRKFHQEFGTWMLYGLRFLSKEAFYTECAYYIPPVMMKLSNSKCFKEFHTEVHYNFS